MADFFRKLFGFKSGADERYGRIASGRGPVRSGWQVEEDGRLASHWWVRKSD